MNADEDIRHPDRDRNDEGKPENARPRDRYGAPLPRDAANELTDRVEPEDVCTTVKGAIESAVELFDQERFFETHEFFEWAWKGPVTDDADRDLFKGLAQMCVGYCHTQRGNKTGAQTLLQRGIDHTEPYGETAYDIDLAGMIIDAKAFLEVLDTDEASPDLSFPTFPSLSPKHPST